MSINTKLKGKERIIAARISLQKSHPFWGYLSMHLNIIESDMVPTMGIDAYGNLRYNPDWVNKLSIGELKGVLAHEILHLVFEHPKEMQRAKYKNIFNIAIDLKNNDILVENNFKLPSEGYIPRNHSYSFDGFTIKDINEKSSIEIYTELKKHCKSMKYKAMDVHMDWEGSKDKKGKKRKGKALAGEGIDTNKKKDWKKLVIKAKQFAQQRGCIPAGMEKFFDDLLTPKLDWRSLLYKYIAQLINSDYTFLKRNKKYTHIYLPGMEKGESIEIVATLDTSGSMWGSFNGEDILKMCLTELAGIARSFSNVDILLIMGDTRVTSVIDMKNATEEDFKHIKLKGGGGTSHKPFYEWIKKNVPNVRLVINLTDGWTEFPDEEIGDTIWVCPPEHLEIDKFPFGKVVVISNTVNLK